MTALPDEDEWTELVDAQFNRVDLVKAGANGIPFLIAKQDGDSRGLIPPDVVRDLIGKQASDPEPTVAGQVTMTGSPAAIAAFIHKAAVRDTEPAGDVAKAKNDTADRKHKAATGAAMPDGSYPIANEADLDKAIHAVGRGGSSHDAIRKHIISRARSLGASSKIPDNWNSDGSLKESVSKETGVTDTVAKDAGDLLDTQMDDGVDGMDPTVPLAAPDEMGPGDPTDPGSPAWESIDAATAQKWTSILARAQVALNLLSDREMLEAASADPDDAENAWDLQDACCAIDYVISVLAPYAVSEQSEADCGADAMAAIGKAMAGLEEVPLDTLTALAQVRKAGRVLSAANEAEIRSAAASLNKVLTTLPQAPQADDSGQPVAKEDNTVTDAQAAAEPGMSEQMGTPKDAAAPAARPVEKAAAEGGAPAADPAPAGEPVAKADDGKATMRAVFDANGNLVGIVDPAAITPVEGATAGAAADTSASGDDGDGVADDAGDEVPADGAAPAAADAADLTPAPSADAGTPADDVNKSATTDQQDTPAASNTPDAHEVLKSIVAELVAERLGSLAPAEDIAKSADVARVDEEIEALKARLATVEEQPAQPKVFTNGQTPPAHMMRGQDRQGPPAPVDVAKALERKRELYTADAPEQNRIAKEMQTDAIAALAAIQRR